MRLTIPLPPDRTLDQLRNHYEVEKAIAKRLWESNREERKSLYRTMYDDLFEKVPDHPRLKIRDALAAGARPENGTLKLVRTLVSSSTVFLEFAPGGCMFAREVAGFAKFVYGVDISDQRNKQVTFPDNFKLIIYDGFELALPEESMDIVFSNQLIEHLHPEDTEHHFRLVNSILKPHGCYLFITPHQFVGPADVSMYFSEEAEGFHLKEWTYREISNVLLGCNYSSWNGYLEVKGMLIRIPPLYFYSVETLLSFLPFRLRRFLATYLLRQIYIIARK